MMMIETERLVLRRPQVADLAAFTAYNTGPRSAFVGGPIDAARAFEKLAGMIGHWALRGFGRYVLVRRESGRGIGHVGALQLDAAMPIEMSWTIWDGADEGHGSAFEAARAYLAVARAETGAAELLARIADGNTASRRLADRLGGRLDLTAPPPKWAPEAVTYRFAV